jgi:hypothetical protein
VSLFLKQCGTLGKFAQQKINFSANQHGKTGKVKPRAGCEARWIRSASVAIMLCDQHLAWATSLTQLLREQIMSMGQVKLSKTALLAQYHEITSSHRSRPNIYRTWSRLDHGVAKIGQLGRSSSATLQAMTTSGDR